MLRTEGNNRCPLLLRCYLSLEHIKRSSCSSASSGLFMTNIALFHTAFSGKTVLFGEHSHAALFERYASTPLFSILDCIA